MDYLYHVLGIHVIYEDTVLDHIPNYIYDRYDLRVVRLDGIKVVFAYPLGELEYFDTVKTHVEKIQQRYSLPVVLILTELSYRYKEYLLRDHIPFVVEGKQIYLPFMAVYLQERSDYEFSVPENLLPSAQLLLLHFIYNGCHSMPTSDAAVYLRLTATSISRASRQLTEFGILDAETRGVRKILYSDKSPRELFFAAQNVLKDPVKRIVYVPKRKIPHNLLCSRYSALSEYTMIAPSRIEYYAADSIASFEDVSFRKLQNYNEQAAIELWRYNPYALSSGRCVDRLSLAIILRDERDERVEEAVDEMLRSVWRDIDDSRY